MNWRIFNAIFSIILLFGLTSPALANESNPTVTPSVVINEVQVNGVGSGTANQEFIEITNISDIAVDLTGWSLEYVNTVGTISELYSFTTQPEPAILYPAGFILGVCKDAPTDYLSEIIPKYVYNPCIAASGAGLILKDQNSEIVDFIYWVSGQDSFSEDIVPLLAGGKSIQRKIENDVVVFTGINSIDYEVLNEPTPMANNVNPNQELPVENEDDQNEDSDSEDPLVDDTIEELPVDETGSTETESDDTTPQDETNIEEQPEAESTLASDNLPILLSELYIDPANPLTDSRDEWVEIYNPNDVVVDLVGYAIYTGTTFNYKHIFETSQLIEPKSYLIITSAESSLALSNSGGAAKIVGPKGQTLDQTKYLAAKNGLSWAKNSNGEWLWSSTPTQGSDNVITKLPDVIKKAAASATAKKTTKKATSTTKPKTSKTTQVKASTITDDNLSNLVDAPSPLPVWLLAILGGLAIIYAAYEYRFELSNKIYQFRKYRENRSPDR